MKILGTACLGVFLVAGSSTEITTSRTVQLRPTLINPRAADTILKSQKPLIVELFWLRILNAVAEPESIEKNQGLYEYAMNLTTLDPRFYQAYYYVGANISFLQNRIYKLGDLEELVLRRGIMFFPEDQRLHLLLAFNLFGVQAKFVEAATVYQKISTLPNAPPYAAPFATRLLAQSGNTNLALELAQQLADSATDETTKSEYEKRVLEIKVEAQLQKVDTAITQFKLRENRPPTDIAELVSKGDYFDSLLDAMGGTISIGKDGRAATTAANRRLEIYERDE
jgi:hypothetical protein